MLPNMTLLEISLHTEPLFLFANGFAPLIDYYVVKGNILRREKKMRYALAQPNVPNVNNPATENPSPEVGISSARIQGNPQKWLNI